MEPVAAVGECLRHHDLGREHGEGADLGVADEVGNFGYQSRDIGFRS